MPFQSMAKPFKMKSILFQATHQACLMRAPGVKRDRARDGEKDRERNLFDLSEVL